MSKNDKKSNKGMAKSGKLCWDFPSTSHGKEDGFSDPAIEFFEGDHSKFIARETIQNAVDARQPGSTDPVAVVFERFIIPAESIPGHRMLLDKMNRCQEFVEGSGQDKAENFFKSAIKILKGAKIPFLKISDYNTVGLSGSDDDRRGNWYRLVRVTGTSSPKGVAGGSFGIGKGAPFAGSALRTVFYSSVDEKGNPVFQGVGRLVSHYNEEKDVRQGIGFYGIDGYKAVRSRDAIPEIFRRDQRGTDVYVMGYKSDSDWQAKIIRSVLHNFWLAILHGDLEVVIKDGAEIRIAKDNLHERLNEYDAEDARFYYEAVTNCSQKFEEPLKHLGTALLFVRKQENYPSRVMMARKPKMLVQEKSYRTLREPYAAVFLCDDERGNRLLRYLEPPAHDRWDRGRAETVENGQAALRELDDFVKEKLRSMGESVTSEPQDIPGVERYLTDADERDYLPGEGSAFDPSELESQEESGREIGAAKESAPAEIEKIIRKSVVTNKRPGIVRPNPPSGPGGGTSGRPTGPEEGGKEGIRIDTSTISFRSFVQKTKDGWEYHFAITGRENGEGAINLAAIGDDSSYPIEVETAVDADTKKRYEVGGSLIKGLSVEKGKTVRLAVRLQSKKKYALGIEAYAG